MPRTTPADWNRVHALALQLHRAATVPEMLEILRRELPALLCSDCRLVYAADQGPHGSNGRDGSRISLGPFELRCEAMLTRELEECLQQIAEHTEVAWSRAVPPVEAAAKHPAYGTLTRRQREVLPLLLSNLSNAEIGYELGISPRTVEKHVAAICSAYGARGRYGLVRRFDSAHLALPHSSLESRLDSG